MEVARQVRHDSSLDPTLRHPWIFGWVIGDTVCEAYDRDHGQILFDEIEFFIETSETEQQRWLSPNLPSTGEYIATRMGTGAVNVCLIEYAPPYTSTTEYYHMN
ncbi:hypothetical protein BDP81DRAFT_451346 [Colletotrichum phormii]|uniref:Uncharacterized protein n=1 Tax=Colletotrichum phormii TaxID=359342 RepID=A0AAI9ZNC6_9PEZI|nr:uncharacterized protein BDP81DRAFT_451346 [Colletotrichum phormii]KAK1634851.1 hypothetical protein BDP81DRAFT_451346 [Colletotrichum phormii]